jgi:hypothetical protein
MAVFVQNIGSYLGKAISDIHGRPAGRILGLSTNMTNEVTAVQIEQNGGDLRSVPVNQLDLNNGSPVLLPDWKIKATEVDREFDTTSRRSSAVDLLLKDGDITSETYEQMKDEYERALDQIKTRRDALVEKIVDRRAYLENQIRTLQAALTNNKMLYSSMEIQESSYKEAVTAIREDIAKCSAEKDDIDNIETMLSKLETDAPKPLDSDPKLPEAPAPDVPPTIPDVVVVKVREDSTA